MFSEGIIDFKDVVSELALHAESKMIIFTSGLLQGFTVGKEAEMIDFHRNKGFSCLDFFCAEGHRV